MGQLVIPNHSRCIHIPLQHSEGFGINVIVKDSGKMKILCDHSKHTDLAALTTGNTAFCISQGLSNPYFSNPYIEANLTNLFLAVAINYQYVSLT